MGPDLCIVDAESAKRGNFYCFSVAVRDAKRELPGSISGSKGASGGFSFGFETAEEREKWCMCVREFVGSGLR